ncbi:Ig-like domain-containing protein [Sphingomonas aerolata]|uniref:Ig-like domain-containing protein n=1 Tax=Sphingomonas aerolata TaxID=185951 RepID=UPI002FE35943
MTAPDAPSAALDQTGTALTGTGDAGAAITVRDADGTVIGTATASATGAFAVILDPAQRDGGTLAVTQADAAGNVSAPALVAVPDVTAPAAPTATVEGDGSLLVGTGEAGTIVTVRDPSGTAIGTATVAADGGFSIVLDPVQADGETLSVTLTDAAGNRPHPPPRSPPTSPRRACRPRRSTWTVRSSPDRARSAPL